LVAREHHGNHCCRFDHKTAPIEIRECLAFPDERIEEALGQVKSLASVKENMILSTCNRVEIYAVARVPEKAVVDLKLSFPIIITSL